MYTRRHLLGTVAAVTVIGGCTEALGDDGESDRTDGDIVRLDELSVQNNHDRDHRVQLAVEGDGEMLHMGTYELDGNGGDRTIDGEWNDATGSYRVHAKLDDGEIRTQDVTDGVSDDASCVRVLVRIDNDGDLGVWNGTDCDPNADDSDFENV